VRVIPCRFCVTWKRSSRHGNWAGPVRPKGRSGRWHRPLRRPPHGPLLGPCRAHAGPRLALARDPGPCFTTPLSRRSAVPFGATRDPEIARRLAPAQGRRRGPQSGLGGRCRWPFVADAPSRNAVRARRALGARATPS
jgi:hypothetical protein